MNKPFIIVISLSLSLILGIGLVWPRYQELKLLEKRNEEKRMEIQVRKGYLQELKKVKAELRNYQNQLAKIDFALPSNPDFEILLNLLLIAGFESGLVLTDIKSPVIIIQEIADPEGFKEIELSFIVSGAYTSFKNFLSVLEMSARLIEVESISFSFLKEELPSFDLRIKVHSY